MGDGGSVSPLNPPPSELSRGLGYCNGSLASLGGSVIRSLLFGQVRPICHFTKENGGIGYWDVTLHPHVIWALLGRRALLGYLGGLTSPNYISRRIVMALKCFFMFVFFVFLHRVFPPVKPISRCPSKFARRL